LFGPRVFPRIGKCGRKTVVNKINRLSARTVATLTKPGHASKKHGWRSAKHAAQWLATIEQHAKPLYDVNTAAVLVSWLANID
jgi:hypothetical protein